MADHAPHLPSPDLTILLRDRAEQIERTRQLPTDVAGAIRDEGLFRTWVPPVYGGPGRTALEGLESIAATAEADGAAGWCVLIALRAKREGLDENAMKSRLQRVVAINMAALFLSAIGLMMVVVGILLG